MSQKRKDRSFELAYASGNLGCKIIDDLIRKHDSFVGALGLDYLHPGIEIRSQYLCGKPPLESLDQPGFHILEIARSNIGSQYELLASLLQIVEYMEESILGATPPLEELNIVQDQDIYLLIEMQEIRNLIPYGGVLVLSLECVGAYI